MFVATGLDPVAATPEPTEELEVQILESTEVARRIAAGELWDGMTIASFRLFEGWQDAGEQL